MYRSFPIDFQLIADCVREGTQQHQAMQNCNIAGGVVTTPPSRLMFTHFGQMHIAASMSDGPFAVY
jgi:hypothetical protein